MRREERARERLDGPVAPAVRAASLADVERLNAWLGGHALTLRALGRLLRHAGGEREVIVADVGGGTGGFAHRIAGDGLRRRLRCVIVVDRDHATLVRAPVTWRQSGSAAPPAPILRVCADAAALPFRERSVDAITCALTLHHLAPEEAVACLGAMRRASRLGVVVNDLLRTRLSLVLVTAATWLLARHAISRHDGPLSVRRAYAVRELRTLCARAGWRAVTVRRHPLLCRVIATAAHEAGGAA